MGRHAQTAGQTRRLCVFLAGDGASESLVGQGRVEPKRMRAESKEIQRKRDRKSWGKGERHGCQEPFANLKADTVRLRANGS